MHGAQSHVGEGSGVSLGPLLGSALLYHRRTKYALLLHLKHVSGHDPSHIRAQESGGVGEWVEDRGWGRLEERKLSSVTMTMTETWK